MNTAIAARFGVAARESANWIQLAMFALVGGSGYVINLGVFNLLDGDVGVVHQVAEVAAFAVAVVNNFLWNRYWTFRSGDVLAGFQAARFFAVSLASLGLNLAVLELVWRAGVVGPITAQAIAVAVPTPFNFLGNKLWTFALATGCRGREPPAHSSSQPSSSSASARSRRRPRVTHPDEARCPRPRPAGGVGPSGRTRRPRRVSAPRRGDERHNRQFTC